MLTDLDKERLGHIRWAIENIAKFTTDGKRAFEGSTLIQHATLYNLTIIGEAVRCLSFELKAQFPHIPWHSIIGMRNVVTHVYFNVKLETGVARNRGRVATPAATGRGDPRRG